MRLYAELLRNMSIIAEDENLLKRAAKYLRKLVAEKKADPTLLTKEEFFARIDKAEKEIAEGVVMGTGTWVWVPVFMSVFLLYF